MSIQQSPVHHSLGAELLYEIDSQQLVEQYREKYGLDVKHFVSSEKVEAWRCLGTSLVFFRGIEAGDGQFYEELMKHDWYYDPWKWEHQVIKEKLQKGEDLLELGCGSGGFLKGIADEGVNASGLELNKHAVEKARSQSLSVFDETIQDFALKNEEGYDWLVSFQVMEHVESVSEILSSSIRLLKKGGKLVISVPNNDSFISRSDGNVLNYPPHHLNHWSEESLSSLTHYFPVTLTDICFEPLQDYHKQWYLNTVMDQMNKNLSPLPLLKRIQYLFAKRCFKDWIEVEGKNIRGHSVLAIYEKHD